MTHGRSRRGDDAAVTEVLGFILMFALSAFILIVSMRSFNAAQDNSNALVGAVELRNIANRVSSRVVQAGIISQEFPQAEFSVTVKVPDEIAGYRYGVQFRDRDGTALSDPPVNPIVYVATRGENLYGEGTLVTGEASIFRVEEITVNSQPIQLQSGEVLSGAGAVTVHYWYDTVAARGKLELTEGST